MSAQRGSDNTILWPANFENFVIPARITSKIDKIIGQAFEKDTRSSRNSFNRFIVNPFGAPPNGLRYLCVGGRGFCLGAEKTRSEENARKCRRIPSVQCTLC